MRTVSSGVSPSLLRVVARFGGLIHLGTKMGRKAGFAKRKVARKTLRRAAGGKYALNSPSGAAIGELQPRQPRIKPAFGH